jgi:hypothetical protein
MGIPCAGARREGVTQVLVALDREAIDDLLRRRGGELEQLDPVARIRVERRLDLVARRRPAVDALEVGGDDLPPGPIGHRHRLPEDAPGQLGDLRRSARGEARAELVGGDGRRVASAGH